MYERHEERHPTSVRILYAAVLRNYERAEYKGLVRKHGCCLNERGFGGENERRKIGKKRSPFNNDTREKTCYGVAADGGNEVCACIGD